MSDLTKRPTRDLSTDRSGVIDDSGMVELWLDRYRNPLHSAGRPTATQHAYRRDWGLFKAGMDERGVRSIRSLTAREASEILADIGQHTNNIDTYRRRAFAMKSLFSYAHKLGYLDFNVLAAARIPPSPNRLSERTLDGEQVYQIISAAPEGPKRTLLRFLYYSGARVSEAAGLQRKHIVKLAAGRLQVTLHGKGNKSRDVGLPPRMGEDLWQLASGLRDNDFVFQALHPRRGSRVSKALRVRMMQKVVREATQGAQIGKDVSPHWMRHAHASHSLDRGAPLHVVQTTLGHSNPATTGRYLHVKEGDSSADYLDK